MLPSTPLEHEATESSEAPPLRKYLWSISPEILQDWEFWEALARIASLASEKEDINLFWSLGYQQLAFACDHISALIFRQDQRPEFGP